MTDSVLARFQSIPSSSVYSDFTKLCMLHIKDSIPTQIDDNRFTYKEQQRSVYVFCAPTMSDASILEFIAWAYMNASVKKETDIGLLLMNLERDQVEVFGMVDGVRVLRHNICGPRTLEPIIDKVLSEYKTRPMPIYTFETSTDAKVFLTKKGCKSICSYAHKYACEGKAFASFDGLIYMNHVPQDHIDGWDGKTCVALVVTECVTKSVMREQKWAGHNFGIVNPVKDSVSDDAPTSVPPERYELVGTKTEVKGSPSPEFCLETGRWCRPVPPKVNVDDKYKNIIALIKMDPHGFTCKQIRNVLRKLGRSFKGTTRAELVRYL